MVMCPEQDADLHMAQLMPLPFTVFRKILIAFIFLVPANPGSPRQRAVKRLCVCVGGEVIAESVKQSNGLVSVQSVCQCHFF